MIYLDSAATTRTSDAVFEKMKPYMLDLFGNPGSVYSFGKKSLDAVNEARENVAAFLGAKSGQILFTSGGSEANTSAFHGVANYLKGNMKHKILISSVEHDSVINAATSMNEFEVLRIPVCRDGTIDIDQLERMMDNEVGLVSVMYVNNEVGSVNNVQRIASICHRCGALFHTDCVQAAGCYKIDVDEIGCDFASISSHKIHGAHGIGALYARDMSQLSPIIYGGSHQEFGLRGGTENVPCIVGFGEACRLLIGNEDTVLDTVSSYKKMFYDTLVESLSNNSRGFVSVKVNGRHPYESGKIANICFDGVDAEALIMALDCCGVCASAGSACRSHEAVPSHVLKSMSLSDKEARGSVRFSFDENNSSVEVCDAAKKTAECASILKNMSEI